MAVGFGGQVLYVDGARRAVVVVLATEARKDAEWDRRLLEVIERNLLPALQAAAPARPAATSIQGGKKAGTPLAGSGSPTVPAGRTVAGKSAGGSRGCRRGVL